MLVAFLSCWLFLLLVVVISPKLCFCPVSCFLSPKLCFVFHVSYVFVMLVVFMSC